MEELELIKNFITTNPLFALLFGGVIFFITLDKRDDMSDEIHDTRKRYQNQSFSYVEDVLQDIINVTYSTACKKIIPLTPYCPQNNMSCILPKLSIRQQKVIYKALLRDIFLISVKNIIKDAIFKNGFHEMDVKSLRDYCQHKAKVIYNYVLLELSTNATDSIPDLLPHIGSNFSEQGAIDAFTGIIEVVIANDIKKDERVRQIRGQYNIFTKLIIYFKSKFKED